MSRQVFDVTKSADDDYAEFLAFKAWQRGQRPEKSAPERTVAELWDEWYPTVELTSRGPNIRAHGKRFVKAMAFTWQGKRVRLGDCLPSECTPALLEAWRARVRKMRKIRGGSVEGDELIAPGYCDQIRLSVQTMFQYFVKAKELRENPLYGLPREENAINQRQGYFTEAQLERFADACRPVLAAILRVSARCGGMRRDEVRLLRKEEIDWASKTIILRASRTKTRQSRRIIITDDALELLRAYATSSPSDYVFGSPLHADGRPISKSTLWSWKEEAVKATGMDLLGERPTVHHTRHAFAVASLEKGAPAQWVAEQMGHKTTQQLDERYGALRGEAEETMRRMMNATVAGHKSTYVCPKCSVSYDDLRAAAACLERHELEARKGPLPSRAPNVGASKSKSPKTSRR